MPMLRLPAKSTRLPPLCRRSVGARLLASYVSFTPEISRSIADEHENVASMDKLLRVARERSDPRHHSVMPMRMPMRWAEALLLSSSHPHAHDAIPARPIVVQAQTEQKSLTPRKMDDSYSEFILPFGSDPELLEQYTNSSGGVQTGRLMEHLDSLAGSIGYKHMLGPDVKTLGQIHQGGFYIATASVDRLDMLAPVNPNRDLRLSGQVIYTGNSSLEVAVKMEHIEMNQPEETVLLGRFSMVCRDAKTNLAHEVNPLVVSTPEEGALYAVGKHTKEKRRFNALRSLSRVPPTSEEAEELHTFFLTYGQDKPTNESILNERVWMGDTRVEKTMLMFPQERNMHQKIFGGYLMRLAYELGYTNASMFTRGPVRFLSLDGISFTRPVAIGSILRLTSQIHYTTSSEQYPTIVVRPFKFTLASNQHIPIARRSPGECCRC
ncbi:hypothetical protein AX15_006727 [Amanita polypyramis BW_CC]|nr:hypothetical protein AX15_006727 [Amanita polypyramis BW_CC]